MSDWLLAVVLVGAWLLIQALLLAAVAVVLR